MLKIMEDIVEIQLSLFEAFIDLICIDLRFVIGGVLLIGGTMYWLCKKNKSIAKFRMAITLIALYYYLWVVLNRIVGFPTVKEFIRLSALGESLFNPNINLIPLVNGLNLEFIFNVFCFIPLGFLCPVLSKLYEQWEKILLIGLGLSLVIEISQLFTLYRATDINDLIANVLGTALGYLCFKFANKFRVVKSGVQVSSDDKSACYLPIIYILSNMLLVLTQY
ncbi:MAG: VanZ family protein [Lachnospiraceae bacterium]|nr:VanZ family protein [Lachnospiraceae bacterium]